MNAREYYYQEQNIEYIKNRLGTEQWIQVCGHRILNDSDAAFWCGLVDAEHIPMIKERTSWDISREKDAYPGFEKWGDTVVYKKCLLDEGCEPILFDRDFYGIRPDYIEISQEFVLLNDLYWDPKNHSYNAIHKNGDTEEVVRYESEDVIYIKSTYLYRYAAAKQKHLILYFDIGTQLDGPLSDYELEIFDTEYADELITYGLWGGELSSSQRNKTYSTLMGKKLIPPMNVERCGYWPFEPEKKYEDFIIGATPTGEEKTHSCNPNTLNNFFDAHPDEPLYFTPVFFRKEVLQKYILKPEMYKISDGRLSCGSFWSIEIDNHHDDPNIISAFLGDIGTYLPEEEQRLWRIYNIASDNSISKVTFSRDFACAFVDSNKEDHLFQANYCIINEQWEKQFGWPLFLSLSETDEYNFSCIRIPILNNQQEFDGLVLSLVKVLIDSLNEKEFEKQISISGNKTTDLKGIGKLEAWLKFKNATGYESHIKYLRELQELRSTGTGHRKGKGYEKISRAFGLNVKTYTYVYTDILKEANAFMNYMKNTFLKECDTLD